MIDDNTAARLRALFQGSNLAHGIFRPEPAPDAKGKIKGQASTVEGPASLADFERHVRGEILLGIIPLQRDGSCWWAAIDDDRKGARFVAENRRRVKELGLPLVVSTSKSGGSHLNCFLRQPTLATTVRAAMSRFAAALGLPENVEIFPKQETLSLGEMGNWLILPTTGLAEFCDAAEAAMIDPAELLTDLQTPSRKPRGDRPMKEGRNAFLLAMAGGLYARELSDEAVEAAVRATNAEADVAKHPNFAEGPLPEDEIRTLLKSAKKLHERGDGVPSWLSELNETYSVVQLGGSVAVMREHAEATTGEPTISFSAIGTMSQWFANRPPVRVGKDWVPLAKAWFTSQHRRQYEGGVVFAPGRQVNTSVYNTWRGWNVQEGDPNGCPRFRQHLREVICAGEDDHIVEYLWNWLAHLVQRPDELPEAAVVLRGPNGAGKGAFVQYVASLVWPHFVHLQDSERLTARFNSHVVGKLLVYADEAFFAGDKRHAGLLKGLISEQMQLIEKKFQEPVKIQNFTRLILASNEDWIVPAELDTRRFLVLDVGNSKVGNRSYFNELLNERREGGPANLLAALRQTDLAGFDIRSVPVTAALARQKELTAQDEIGFVLDLLHHGRLPGREGPGRVPFKLLVDAYLDHAKERGARRRSLETSFSTKLRGSSNRPGLLPPKEVRKCVVYDRPTGRYSEGIQLWERDSGSVWHLPSLAECRANFERAARQKLDWSDDPDEWLVVVDEPVTDVPF